MASKLLTKPKHITTICGPQAEAIKAALERGSGLRYEDHSVPGLTILEVFEGDC